MIINLSLEKHIKNQNLKLYIIFLENLDFEIGSKDNIIIPDNLIFDLRKLHYGPEQTNFTSMLFRLIFKADFENLNKLSSIYPNEVFLVWCYHHVKGFFEKYIDEKSCYYCEGDKSQRLIKNDNVCCPNCKRNF